MIESTHFFTLRAIKVFYPCKAPFFYRILLFYRVLLGRINGDQNNPFLGVIIVQTFEYSSKTIKMCAHKYFLVKNNTKSHYKLLKSASLVPGQLRNLPVKIEQICFPFNVQILNKIKLFF